MTITATHPADLVAQSLPAEIVERLDRLRPHTLGANPAQVTALVEQAFRNFPATVSTPTLVAHLIATPKAATY